MNPKELRIIDPVHRNADKGCDDAGTSPMDPPDAYAPPGEGQGVSFEAMHPLLQDFRKEHDTAKEELDLLDACLDEIDASGPSDAAEEALGRFFRFMESVVLPHNRREERVLFPLLRERLIASGEHSRGRVRRTGIDVLEADHQHLVQLTAVMLNFFGVAGHLPDEPSRKVVISAALHQGRALIETLRLHIYREDEVILSLAHSLISSTELDRLADGLLVPKD